MSPGTEKGRAFFHPAHTQSLQGAARQLLQKHNFFNHVAFLTLAVPTVTA
jgi:hypothetical protein